MTDPGGALLRGALCLGGALCATALAIPLLGLRRRNYLGDTIPVGWGLAPALAALAALAIAGQAAGVPAAQRTAFILTLATFAALGLADDLWGTREHTGIRGHLRALAQRRTVTTGMLKATGGTIVALIVPLAILREPVIPALLAGGLIALSANTVNLLDLRPGRAGAGALCAGTALAVILARAGQSGAASTMGYLVASLLPVYIVDRRGRAMLGDVGSNALGAGVGLAFALAFGSILMRGTVLILLLALHAAAERVSLSAVIERTPWLRALDRLTGVRPPHG